MNVRGLSPLASKQDTLKMKTKHGKMPVIGNARVAIVAERDRAFSRELCCGIADAASRENGWMLEFVDADSLKRTQALRGFDGVIARVVNDTMATRLTATGLPVVDVFCNKRYPNFGFVDGNQAAIARKAAEHFLARRFTSFAYCGYEGQRYSDVRCTAFVDILKEHYLPCSVFKTPRRALVKYNASLMQGEDVNLGADVRRLAQWLVRLPPRTAVFCCNDLRAWQVLSICRDENIAVPDNLVVLGVDNDPLVCSFVTPSISSIDNSGRRIGEASVAVLSQMLSSKEARANPPFVCVEPGEVVQRSSTETYAFAQTWISDALVYISRNAEKRLTADDIAVFVGKSLPTVEDGFRKALGRTVQQELIASRLSVAKRLLANTTLPVVDVSARSGFASAQYFCRVFKAYAGITAESWREQNRKL